MTLGGCYGTRNDTVRDLREQKGKRVLFETMCFTTQESAAAEEAGIDTMKLRCNPRSPQLTAESRRAASHTLMAFAIPQPAVPHARYSEVSWTVECDGARAARQAAREASASLPSSVTRASSSNLTFAFPPPA